MANANVSGESGFDDIKPRLLTPSTEIGAGESSSVSDDVPQTEHEVLYVPVVSQFSGKLTG